MRRRRMNRDLFFSDRLAVLADYFRLDVRLVVSTDPVGAHQLAGQEQLAIFQSAQLRILGKKRGHIQMNEIDARLCEAKAIADRLFGSKVYSFADLKPGDLKEQLRTIVSSLI